MPKEFSIQQLARMTQRGFVDIKDQMGGLRRDVAKFATKQDMAKFATKFDLQETEERLLYAIKGAN